MCTWVHLPMSTHGGQSQWWGFPSIALHLTLWDRASDWAWSLPCWLNCLAVSTLPIFWPPPFSPIILPVDTSRSANLWLISHVLRGWGGASAPSSTYWAQRVISQLVYNITRGHQRKAIVFKALHIFLIARTCSCDHSCHSDLLIHLEQALAIEAYSYPRASALDCCTAVWI